MKYKKLLAGLLSCALIFTASCSSDTSTGSGNANSDTITIGQIGPITGNYAIYGISTFNGVELAMEQFGDINGKKVVASTIDDQGNPADAINAYSKLVDGEKVSAIIGGVTSGSTSAIVEASKANNTPMVTPTATLDSITSLGTNIFRACFKDSYQGNVMAEYAKDKLNAKTAAIIYNNSSDYSSGLYEAFKETFEANGGTIVAVEAYSDSDVNFKVQLSKIQSANPDVVFAPDYYEKIALLAKQVRDTGITATLLGPDGWDGVLELVTDPEVLNNSYISNAFSVDDPSESVQKFIKDYEAKYGETPNGFAASGYDAAMVMLEALKVADTNGELNNEGIIKALHETNVEGINGTIKFDENRDAIKGAVIIEYKDGKAVLVDKIDN